MPPVSDKQRKAAGAALAAKEGKEPKKYLKGASLQMYKSMSIKSLRDFARNPSKGVKDMKKRGRKKGHKKHTKKA